MAMTNVEPHVLKGSVPPKGAEWQGKRYELVT
jgi:hypothetical protein